jgi:hypothetical protein
LVKAVLLVHFHRLDLTKSPNPHDSFSSLLPIVAASSYPSPSQKSWHHAGEQDHGAGERGLQRQTEESLPLLVTAEDKEETAK